MFVSYNLDKFRVGMNIPNISDRKVLDELQILNFSMSSFVTPDICQDVDVFTLKQVHGVDVVFVENGKVVYKDTTEPFSYSLKGKFEGDAIICVDRNIRVGVRTADCAPIIFFGVNIVGVIHAGWRGLKSGIVENTINLAVGRYDFRPSEGLYYILPCIHSCCYEVGREFIEWAEEFCLIRNEKVYFDIPKFVLSKLEQLGAVEDNIYYSPICTSCYSNVFPSFRASNTQDRFESFIELF
ncbi:MAG: polyphenol oxidase family protein [Brevinematia bacterium]